MQKIFIGLFLLAASLPLCAQEAAASAPAKNRIILAPVVSLTDNQEFMYLKGTIYNVLLINLKKQERIAVVNEEPGAAAVIDAEAAFEPYLASLARAFPGSSAIMAEYYVAKARLNILVNVWDVSTRRIKNSFTETMPADLDLLANIEKMSANIAEAVARALPPTEREALFNKEVAASLRKKINDEDMFVEEIFAGRHELALAPFTGLGLGRTVISWTANGPLVSPLLSLGYSYWFDTSLHLRLNLEYLGFDLSTAFGSRQEATFEALIGINEKSSFSFSADVGLALIYDYNLHSAALAYTAGTVPEYPEARRLSLSLPIAIGFSVYLTPHVFFNLAFKYHGLTLTFEPQDYGTYDVGASQFRYYDGLSAWNFTNMAIQLQVGMRL
jgi:hypothetical protein